MLSEGQELPITNQERNITFTGLTKSTLDLLGHHIRHKENIGVASLVFVGLKTAFPERFKTLDVNDPNVRFFGSIVWLGIELNDACDMLPQVRAEGNQEAANEVFTCWKAVIRHSKAIVASGPDKEFKEKLLSDYQREILAIERKARVNPDEWDLAKILRYREIVNGISVVANAAALLGEEALPRRLDSIDKADLSWETLEKKYSWLIDGKPATDTEKRLCALFYMMMGIQITDDWLDIKNDTRLELNTIATVVLKKQRGKPEFAIPILDHLSNSYWRKAKTFGVSKQAWISFNFLFEQAKKVSQRFPTKAGGKREILLNGGLEALQSAATRVKAAASPEQ